MKKRIIVLIILLLIIVTGCSNKNIEGSDNTVENIKVLINEKEYVVNLENNETVSEFIKTIPLEIIMDDLNANEKYVYLDNSLPTNSYNPKKIEVGDVMLFGDNCLVIFYKSFNTSYSYTKIGHINNLPELENNSITVKFYK